MRPIAMTIDLLVMLVGFLLVGVGEQIAPRFLVPLGIPVSGQAAQYIGVVLFGFACFQLYAWYAPTRFDKLKITDESLFWSRGAFSKYVIEVSIDSVRRLHITQGPLQRWLGVGDVTVFTEGERPVILVRGLPEPERIRALVTGRMTAAAA